MVVRFFHEFILEILVQIEQFCEIKCHFFSKFLFLHFLVGFMKMVHVCDLEFYFYMTKIIFINMILSLDYFLEYFMNMFSLLVRAVKLGT